MTAMGVEKAFSLWSLFTWIFDNIQYVLFFLALGTFIIIGTKESLEQDNPFPLVEQTAGRVVNADYYFGEWFSKISDSSFYHPSYYDKSEDALIRIPHNIKEFFKSSWSIVSLIWLVFCNAYFLWFGFHWLYKFFIFMGDGGIDYRAVSYSLISLAFIQIIYKVGLLINTIGFDLIKSIIYGVGVIIIGISLVFFFHAKDVGMNSFSKGFVLIAILLFLTGIGIASQTFEIIPEIGETLIPFTGTFSVIQKAIVWISNGHIPEWVVDVANQQT